MFLFLFASFVSISALSEKFRSSIIVSDMTSEDLVSGFLSLSSSSCKIPILTFSDSVFAALKSLDLNLIFDFTASKQYQIRLKNYASSHQILYFSSEEPSDIYSRWEFFLHPSAQIEANAIETLANYLNWTDYHITSSQTPRSKAMFSVLSSSFPDVLSNDANQEVFDLFTARIIKASGNWKVVILSEETGASKILQGFEKSLMYKERCGLIFSNKASRGALKLGTIAVVEEGLEESTSDAEYEFKSILRVIRILEELTESFKARISNDILLKKLEENTSNHAISSYSIVNFKDTSRIVGRIENRVVEVWEEIVFPGNVTVMNNSPPEVLISANTGPYEWDNSYNYFTVALNLGLQPMVQIVNNDSSLLPNFHLELHETDCGSFLFNYDYTSECMKKHIDKLGVAHLSAINATTTESYLDLFAEYDLTLANIGAGYNNETIFNKTIFPEVVITTPKTLYYFTLWPYIMRNFGWDRIVVLFNHGVDPYYEYAFLAVAEILMITVVNPSEYMHIPYFKTDNYNQEVNDVIEYIYQSRCRIIVLLVDPHSHLFFMEALYDYGFRRNEVILIYETPLFQVIDYPEEYKFNREKVLELADGSLSIYYAEYIGDYGKQLEEQIAAMIHPSSTVYTCYRIDSLMLAVRTIDLMIRIGRNFEEFDDLMYFMRGIEFTGCTGKISIDSAGNGLGDIAYTLNNFYITEDGWKDEVIGSYTLGVTVPLKLTKQIIWPNGATEYPEDTIQDPLCGFSSRLVKANRKSQNISIIVIVLSFVVVSVASLVMFGILFNKKRELLEERKEMYFEDGVFLYLPFLEGLQFIALGPSFETANPYLSSLCHLAILDLDHLIDFEFGKFWNIITIAIIASGLWFFALIITLTKLEDKTPKWVKDFLDFAGFKFTPLYSRFLFVGVNLLLLKLFDCRNGISDTATDSFLENDCKTFCWKGKHLYYVIAATFVLLIFNFCSIVMRSTYDELMEYVRVKFQPLYGFLLGLFQFLLVCLRSLLKEEYETIFSVVYCLCFIIWTTVTFLMNGYNYQRLNMWTRVVLATVCLHQFCMVFYTVFQIPGIVLIILQGFIFVGGASIGVYLQFTRYPSLFFRRKGRNFDKLLKFNFTQKISVQELTLHELDYVQREQYGISQNN